LVKDRQTNVEGVIKSMGSQLQPSLLDNEIAITTFPRSHYQEGKVAIEISLSRREGCN
jgi:hypothetical protein